MTTTDPRSGGHHRLGGPAGELVTAAPAAAAAPAATEVPAVPAVASGPTLSGPAPSGGEVAAVGTGSRSLPLRAALVTIAGFVVVLLAERLVVGSVTGRGGVVVALAAIAGQYGAMYGLCRWTTQRWATGSMRHDLGGTLRQADIWRGVRGWLAGFGAVVVVGAVLRTAGVPYQANNPLSASGEPIAPHWLVVVVAAVLMVGLAPLFEELLFRGVVLRAFSTVLPAPVAIAGQGIVFGLFHLDPRWGSANIGLVAVISTLGIVLGLVTHRSEGRVGGAMIAHSLHNALALGVGLAAFR